MMTLAELLEEQYKQQQKLSGDLPRDKTERKLLAQRYTTYLMAEAVEYLNASGYKHFVPVDEAPRASRIIELVDILKFLLAVCWTEEVSAAELEEAFRDKTEVTYRRYMNKEIGSFVPVCGFDIDGVLAGKIPNYSSEMSEEEKDKLFESGVVLKLEPIPGAADTLSALKREGWAVVLITSRKFWNHQKLEYETYEWLRQNEMPFDRMLCGYDKSEVIAKSNLQFQFHVEDDPKHAIDVANNGTKVYLLGHPEVKHERIVNVNNLSEVVNSVC